MFIFFSLLYYLVFSIPYCDIINCFCLKKATAVPKRSRATKTELRQKDKEQSTYTLDFFTSKPKKEQSFYIIFHSVPKCGSTTIINYIKGLQSKNRYYIFFKIIHNLSYYLKSDKNVILKICIQIYWIKSERICKKFSLFLPENFMYSIRFLLNLISCK